MEIRRGLTLLFVLMVAPWSQAALVDRGDTTLDTETGLEWLDPYLTLGYNLHGTAHFLCDPGPCLSLTDAMRPGGAFEGFHVATDMEVGTLFQDAGITAVRSTKYSPTHPYAQPIFALAELLGPPWRFFVSTPQTTIGVNTSTPRTDSPAQGAVVGYALYFNGITYGEDLIYGADSVAWNGGISLVGNENSPVGFWLARPVPVPPPLYGMVAALLGLLTFGLRRNGLL